MGKKKQKERLNSLAREKSRYQLLSDILSDLIKVRGLDKVVNHIVHTVMDAWGGMNVILYYQLNGVYYKSDVYEENQKIESIEDHLVNQVWESGVFLESEYRHDIPVFDSLSHLQGDSKLWIYPLKGDEETFGVIKIEGVFLSFIDHVRDILEIIIHYFAMILRNELLAENRMMAANRALKHEIQERIEDQIRYRNIIESSFDGFWILDTQGNFLEVNDIYCTMSGYSREELLNMKISQVEATETPIDTKIRIENLMKKGKGRFESCHISKDGSLINVEVNTVYSELKNGRFYVFIRDITERIKAEEERKLLQEQYFQSQKVESIGRLAGGIAHDLNNLLTPILGYSEIILDEFDSSDPKRDYIQEINSAGLRARDLVNQLLVFSRKQTLEFHIADLNQIISGFQKLLRRTIRENIEFRFELASDLGSIKADRGQIEQVLMNLSVNSQDAMPRGGVLSFITDQLEVKSEKTPRNTNIEPGQYIRLRVIDSGLGMNKETVRRIFEPFYSTKGDLGTGLGLATVYGIVTQHEGIIDVDSQIGKGTTFSLYFPLCQEEIKSEGERMAEDKLTIHEGQILLVEDNEQLRNLACEVLKRKGFHLLVAENGIKGWELLKQHSQEIDLLLTDIIMPELNGRELHQRALEINPHMKVLFMSGYNNESINSFGIQDDDKHFLQKPFTIGSLLSKVAELLD